MNTSSASSRSRLALVNRTNSDDLNDFALGRTTELATTRTKKTSRRTTLKGTKKSNTTLSQQQHVIERKASAAPHDGARRRVVDDSSLNSESPKRLLTKTNQRASTQTLSTVSSDLYLSDESVDSRDNHKEDNDISICNINCSSTNNSKILGWEHGWLHDDGLTKTTVYYHRLNGPITLLQAAVRSKLTRIHIRKARIQQLQADILLLQNMAARRIQARVRRIQERARQGLHAAARCIQARVRLIQGKRARAVTRVQALARGWMARLQYKVLVLEQRLSRIHTRRDREIRVIRQNQKLEMRRVDNEYQVIAGKENKRQGKKLEAASEDIYALRRENRNLRLENETLEKAAYILTKKNERTIELTAIHDDNFQQLQRHVPQFERDHAQISAVSQDYVERIQRYELALDMRREHLRFERKVTQCLVMTIDVMLKHIDDRCTDVALKRAILDQARETLKGTKKTDSLNNNSNSESDSDSDSSDEKQE